MSSKRVHVVILCEDLQQDCFIRRFLKLRGYGNHDFKPILAPAARGSAEQFVREEFPRQLTAHRSQSSRSATCLIVCTDADNLSIQQRIESLRKACTDSGVPFRNEDEQVCFVVPKRNIET